MHMQMLFSTPPSASVGPSYHRCSLLLLTLAILLDFSTFAVHGSEVLHNVETIGKLPTHELPKPLLSFVEPGDNDDLDNFIQRNGRSMRPTLMDIALQASAREGLNAMALLYRKIEPDILRNGARFFLFFLVYILIFRNLNHFRTTFRRESSCGIVIKIQRAG